MKDNPRVRILILTMAMEIKWFAKRSKLALKVSF